MGDGIDMPQAIDVKCKSELHIWTERTILTELSMASFDRVRNYLWFLIVVYDYEYQ